MRFQVAVTPAVARYVDAVSDREPDLLRELRRATARMLRGSGGGFADRMLGTSADQGQLLQTLVRATGARRAVEVGVFTGYSLISTALALPADGLVVGCEIDADRAAVAKDFCGRAGVGHKVDIRVGDARETLAGLLADGAAGTVDFVFVDADKVGYASYYESALLLLRPGGLVVVDNVLWQGRVADPADEAEETVALRAFNDALHRDERIDLSVLPLGDGMTLAVKR